MPSHLMHPPTPTPPRAGAPPSITGRASQVGRGAGAAAQEKASSLVQAAKEAVGLPAEKPVGTAAEEAAYQV